MYKQKKVILIILDGFAFGDRNHQYNAVQAAKTLNIDYLVKKYYLTFINASENYVGLPNGQMGNSEVGHMIIGSGRVLYQSLTNINRMIEEKKFQKMNFLKMINKTIHAIGLLSDGGVHSHEDHLYEILTNIPAENEILLHIILDGRDTKFDLGKSIVEAALTKINELNKNIKIATISGRFYAMDRDKKWNRTKEYYDVLINKSNAEDVMSVIEYIKTNYENNIFDEFIKPISFKDHKPIADEDAIIFFNFRPDRMRQIYEALCDKNFSEFETKKIHFSSIISMVNYIEEKNLSDYVIVEKQSVKNCLSEVIANSNLTQIKIAETEKYPHITYFFNGGQEECFDKEDRRLIKSANVLSYDEVPQMQAEEIKNEIIKSIDNNYNLIVANFANCDMVGHTGNFEASVAAVEFIDKMIGEIYAHKNDYDILITADHGNVEMMKFEDGKKHTQHTLEKVPAILITDKKIAKIEKNGNLSDIATTILSLMDLEIPKEMTGQVLFKQ